MEALNILTVLIVLGVVLIPLQILFIVKTIIYLMVSVLLIWKYERIPFYRLTIANLKMVFSGSAAILTFSMILLSGSYIHKHLILPILN